jgi:hypothetical protein
MVSVISFIINSCLVLLKLLHRLHHPTGSAWALWVTGQINLRSGGGLARTHWAALRDLFPAYQCITVVSVFCNDRWLLDKPLAQHLLALHGQFAGHSDSVHDVVHAELRGLFQQRLTAQAATEFQLLQELLHSVNLDYTPDKRTASLKTITTDSCPASYTGRGHAATTSAHHSSSSGETL